MSDTTTAPLIACVGTVFVTVPDQDQALEFYVGKLGMELRSDQAYGEGERWVEVAPPGAQTVLALTPPMGDGPHEPQRDLQFGYDCEDVERTVAELSARGVEFDDIMRMPAPVPPMVWFTDPFGNRCLIVQRADTA